MKSKYIGTIVGFGLTIPGLLSLTSGFSIIFSVFSILFYFPIALPLELLGSRLFNNYALTALLVLMVLTTAFGISSFYFFKSLIRDRNERKSVNLFKFWGYIILQLFIIHPLFFYIWALINSNHAGDGQFMFGIFETFPFSSMFFLLIGFIIDLVKNENDRQ